ncbi:hypothetical protein [Streptomyces bikiniensis]|uniref:hypothetical protein n=1 Tax=Streptomyces bikiniensis TaxID=1896 RepID=UPI00068D2DDB|nr:hypothetical protein [Streptomyces bikiniensis]
MTATAIGHLVRAGLLAYLGADTTTPDVHPEQVAALARRRDLPALLDRHVPLGPDRAARRLGVRRTEWDQIVRLGWITPIGMVGVDCKRARGGVMDVLLYSGRDIALLPVVRPSVDWWALCALALGRRSRLTVLAPLGPGPEGGAVFLAEVVRMAGVGRAVVVNWHRRHDDFPAPAPAAGAGTRPWFGRAVVVAWLLAHDKIAVPVDMPSATLTVWSGEERECRFRLDDPVLELPDDVADEDRLTGWISDAEADALAVLAAAYAGVSVRRLVVPVAPPFAVPGGVRVLGRFRSGSGVLRCQMREGFRLPWHHAGVRPGQPAAGGGIEGPGILIVVLCGRVGPSGDSVVGDVPARLVPGGEQVAGRDGGADAVPRTASKPSLPLPQRRHSSSTKT